MRPLVFALALAASPATAHDFWIQPEAFQAPAGAPTTITLQVGHGAERQRSQLPMRRIQRFAAVGPDGVTRDMRSALDLGGATADGALTFDAPGGHVLVLETDSRARSNLPADRFRAYAEEEGLTPALATRPGAALNATAATPRPSSGSAGPAHRRNSPVRWDCPSRSSPTPRPSVGRPCPFASSIKASLSPAPGRADRPGPRRQPAGDAAHGRRRPRELRAPRPRPLDAERGLDAGPASRRGRRVRDRLLQPELRRALAVQGAAQVGRCLSVGLAERGGEMAVAGKAKIQPQRGQVVASASRSSARASRRRR